MSGIIDCEMHIGDEVFVHGYIDEIRNDTIIIRNVGGYFGTSRDEVFYYEKDESEICDFCRYYNNNIPCGSTPSACKKADKFAKEFVDGLKKLKSKDKSQTQLTVKCLECNNSKVCKENHWKGCRYEPLGYEVTAVVGTIKDESITDYDKDVQLFADILFDKEKSEQFLKECKAMGIEPQTIRCPKCGRIDYIRDMEKDMGIKGSYYRYKCINCNTYIKDESQIEGSK